MGQLFVVSAPSGAGKTTLCRRLLERTPDLRYSISHTTRSPRPGETDGKDYFFVSVDRFKEMIAAGEFLEWAEVFGRYYGTSKSYVLERLNEEDVLADVDIEGARQIKAAFPGGVFMFIVPPSLDELVRRLKDRGTESPDQLSVRLGRVREEIEACSIYDYLIVNDDIERAVSDMACLVRAERLRFARRQGFWPEFFGEQPPQGGARG